MSLSPTLRRWLLLLVIAAVVIVLDQVTKAIILNKLAVYETLPILPPVLQLTHSTNDGAAFGFGAGSGDIFLIIAVVVVIAMLIFYPRIEGRMLVLRVAMGLIVGGALGNAIDRMVHGHVIDFIHYQIPDVISNVSNLADHAIVLGVLLVFYDSWFGASAKAVRQKKLESAAAAQDTPPVEAPPNEQHNSP